MMYMQDETTRWLKEQLRRLEAWRAELASGNAPGETTSEQLDQHKAWLETRLAALGH